MKLSELEEGTIFCINGTSSYPKLKLKKGYVDIRDEIFKANAPDWDVDIISDEDFFSYLEDTFRITKTQATQLLDRLKGESDEKSAS